MKAQHSAGQSRRHLHRSLVVGLSAVALGLASLTAATNATSTPVVTAGAVTASVPTVAVDPVSQPAGILVLTTGTAGNQVTYKKPGAPDVVQAFSSTSCVMSPTSGSLLNFKGFVNGVASTVGLRNGSIGVKDGTSTAMACGRVSTTSTTVESLQIDVNVGRPAGAVKPVATSAFLDLEVKGNAKIQAITSLNGVTTGTYELQAGTSIGSSPTRLSTMSSDDTHVSNPYCGAVIDAYDDDGYRDNCRFAISVPSWLGADDGNVFDSITLKALQGSFSLEGGTDGTTNPLPPATFPQRGSIFELSESVLSCGDTTALPVDGVLPGAVVKRLDNSTDPASCNPVPFTLTHSANTITFLKPITQAQNAQFTLTATWPVTIGVDTPGDQALTQYEFTPGYGARDITWCPDPTYMTDANGNLILTGIADLASKPDLEPDNPPTGPPGMPGKQYTCLATSYAAVSQPVSPAVLGTLQIVQQIYIAGDVRYTH